MMLLTKPSNSIKRKNVLVKYVYFIINIGICLCISIKKETANNAVPIFHLLINLMQVHLSSLKSI